MKTLIRILVDNSAEPPWKGEHGLSLLIEHGRERILFDTGAGKALPENLRTAGIEPDFFTGIVLSHGHNDHTGGLGALLSRIPGTELFFARGVEKTRCSLHPGSPVHWISMPESAVDAWQKHGRKKEMDSFTEIAEGVFLTGPIPRESGEDCGGPFFLDCAGTLPDGIGEEQAMLLDSGVLIQGCCHAGIENTVEYCRRERPGTGIRVIAGGLHLVHASAERLERTARYLNSLNLEKVILLHCTGEEACGFLKKRLECPVIRGKAGDVFSFSGK